MGGHRLGWPQALLWVGGGSAPGLGYPLTLEGKGVACLEEAVGTGMGAASMLQWDELCVVAVPGDAVLGVFPAQLTSMLTSALSSAGFVVGHAGLYQALAMFAVAYFIIGMTVLSVCAIATNGALDAGGAYCILCRGCCWGRACGTKSGDHPVASGCHAGAGTLLA